MKFAAITAAALLTATSISANEIGATGITWGVESEAAYTINDAAGNDVEDFGVKVNLIGILSRTFGAPTSMLELEALLAHKKDIVALDLAGDELGYPAELFVEHFSKARDADWQITVHAGEADGPQSVWNAINKL